LHSKKGRRSRAGEKNRYKIGLQGTTVEGEGARVKLYVSELFECNTRNNEEGMVRQPEGQEVSGDGRQREIL
jgi:hypothetical protein